MDLLAALEPFINEYAGVATMPFYMQPGEPAMEVEVHKYDHTLILLVGELSIELSDGDGKNPETVRRSAPGILNVPKFRRHAPKNIGQGPSAHLCLRSSFDPDGSVRDAPAGLPDAVVTP